MPGSSELNPRARSVLTEVVSDFIAAGEPVGSRTIAKRYAEHLSPATIRNVMSDLEDMGYLEQPHISSGRVPTDKGYRFFVDQLLNPGTVFNRTPELISQDHDYRLPGQNLQDILERACNTLSQNSNNAGLVMIPSFSSMLFKHVEFVKVGKTEALAVFISDMGILQKKIIPIEEAMTQDDLTSVSKYLNREFDGKSLKSIRREILRRMKSEREHYDKLVNSAMRLWSRAFVEDAGDILVDGMVNLFDHPDFSVDLEKIKVLFQALEEKSKLMKILDTCLHHDGMTVIIGQEISEEEMHGCSVIAQNYSMADRQVGAMAVIGPKRMDYKKMITLVNHTAQAVSRILCERKNRS
jgi:heat-inducible transcriptional repressor